MEIKRISNQNEFDTLTEDWRKLAVYQFGPLSQVEDNEDVNVLVAFENDNPVAYLIAERNELWHVETKPEGRSKGYARVLAEQAEITFAWEVCSDDGAAFCEALGIEFDDCRE